MMSAQTWPTPQEYNEAIQTPRLCFSDETLREGEVDVNSIGLPRSATGNFASVYKVTDKDGIWAFRCFLTQTKDQKERYRHISEFVLFDDLEWTVDFYYTDNGIKVGGAWYPAVKMPWLDGPTIEAYIRDNLGDRTKLKTLVRDFRKLCLDLENSGIAHGDLQHGNILVTSNGLRLVDYDAMFVPALTGWKSAELGHPNYQHPLRSADQFDVGVSNFSAWLILTSLVSVAIDPGLFKQLDGGDDCILFRRADLMAPDESSVFKRLFEHDSPEINASAQLLRKMLWAAPQAVPSLSATAEELNALPQAALDAGTGSIEVSHKEDLQSLLLAASDSTLLTGPPIISKKRAKRTTKLLVDKTISGAKRFSTSIFWAGRPVQRAEHNFRAGNYAEALKFYSKFKSDETEQAVAMLIRAAHCAFLQGQTNSAGSFLILAGQITQRQSGYFATTLTDLLSYLRRTWESLEFEPEVLSRVGNLEDHLVSSPPSALHVAQTKVFHHLMIDSLPSLQADGKALKDYTLRLINLCARLSKAERIQYFALFSAQARILAERRPHDPYVRLMLSLILCATKSATTPSDRGRLIHALETRDETLTTALLDTSRVLRLMPVVFSLDLVLCPFNRWSAYEHWKETIYWLWMFLGKSESLESRIKWIARFDPNLIRMCMDEGTISEVTRFVEGRLGSSDITSIEDVYVRLMSIGRAAEPVRRALLSTLLATIEKSPAHVRKRQLERVRNIYFEYPFAESDNSAYVDFQRRWEAANKRLDYPKST